MHFIPTLIDRLKYKIEEAESLVLSAFSLINNMNNVVVILVPHVPAMNSCFKNRCRVPETN